MRKLLVISPTPTHPTIAGNRARIRKWLEICQKSGVDFHFAFFRHEPGDEAAMIKAWGADRCTFLDYKTPPRRYSIVERIRLRVARLFHQSLVIPYRIDDWCSDSLVHSVRQLAERLQPDCVQIEYVFFSRLFSCFDQRVYKILDTHDIVAGREQMFLELGQAPEWFYTTREQESIGVIRADHIVAIQEQECAYFRGLTRKPVTTVGHIVEEKLPQLPVTKLPTLVFIGSGNRVNQDAVEFLLKDIWPMIRASVPEAVLEIYGSVCASALIDIPGTKLVGEVVDVNQAYDRAWVVLCPLRFGTGLKIKSIEALGRGKALVSMNAGCTGIEDGKGSAFLCAETTEDFVNHCITILKDAKLRQDLEQKAAAYAAAWNSMQSQGLLEIMAAAGLRRANQL